MAIKLSNSMLQVAGKVAKAGVINQVSSGSASSKDIMAGYVPKNTGSNVSGRIAGAQGTLAELGGKDTSKRTNALGWLLENLPRSSYAANNMLKEFIDDSEGNTPDRFDPIAAWVRGFRKQETPLGKDIMTGLGLSGDKAIFGGGDPHIWNPSPAGFTGLLTDIFNPADPINWLGFGLGGVAKKGGISGASALSKSFGANSAGKIGSMLGEEAVEGIGARTVGKVIKQVTDKGRTAGLDEQGMESLVNLLRQGMTDTGANPKTKLNYWQGRPITVGLTNPLTLGLKGNFVETGIKGSEHLTGQISKGINAAKGTRVGDTLNEMFNTKYVSKDAPGKLFIRDRAVSELNNLVKQSISSGKKLPVTAEMIKTWKQELNNISLVNIYDINKGAGGINFDTLAGITGTDSSTLLKMFDEELPFTYSIYDMFGKFSKNGVDPQEALHQATLLRGTMDKIVDLVPNEFRSSFKGTIMTPNIGVKYFDGSPALGKSLRTSDSPFINYIFSHKGVDIALPVNTSDNFNKNMWARLKEAIKLIDDMPTANIKALREQLQLAPVEIGLDGGEAIKGMTYYGDVTLFDIDKSTFAHELGHAFYDDDMLKGGAFVNDFMGAQKKDYMDDSMKDFVSPYSRDAGQTDMLGGFKEDMAESFRLRDEDYAGFSSKFPNRAEVIERALQDGKITPEELEEIMSFSGKRAEKIDSAYGAASQLDVLQSKIDTSVSDILSSGSGETMESSAAINQMRSDIFKVFEKSIHDATEFTDHVKTIFRDVPKEEMPKIVQLASEFDGSVKPGKPDFYTDINNRINPTFHSKLRQIIDTKMGGKMPAEDLQRMLKSNGIKDEELKWSYFDELIGDKKIVTKAEVQEWLDLNNLKLEEKILERFNTHYGNSDYNLPGGRDYKELLITMPNVRGKDFIAPHFGNYGNSGEKLNENLLVHARFNTRYDNEGRKILFLEEIQSDWHERGLTRGYGEKEPIMPKVIELVNPAFKGRDEIYAAYKAVPDENITDILSENMGKFKANYENLDLLMRRAKEGGVEAFGEGAFESTTDRVLGELVENINNMRKEIIRSGKHNVNLTNPLAAHEQELMFLRADIKKLATDTVPDAPFKNTWRNLAMKRLLKYAAQEDFDGIAWTSGAQQNTRWMQTHNAGMITYNPSSKKLITYHVGDGSKGDLWKEVDLENDITKQGVVRGFEAALKEHLTPAQIKYLTDETPLKLRVDTDLGPSMSENYSVDDILANPTDDMIAKLDTPRKTKYVIRDENGNRFPWNYNSVDEAQRAIDDYYVAGQGTRSISMAEFGGNKDMLQFGGGGFRSSYDEMIPQAMKDALKKSKQQGKIEEIAITRENGDRPFTQHLESILADGEDGPDFIDMILGDIVSNVREGSSNGLPQVLKGMMKEAELKKLTKADSTAFLNKIDEYTEEWIEGHKANLEWWLKKKAELDEGMLRIEKEGGPFVEQAKADLLTEHPNLEYRDKRIEESKWIVENPDKIRKSFEDGVNSFVDTAEMTPLMNDIHDLAENGDGFWYEMEYALKNPSSIKQVVDDIIQNREVTKADAEYMYKYCAYDMDTLFDDSYQLEKMEHRKTGLPIDEEKWAAKRAEKDQVLSLVKEEIDSRVSERTVVDWFRTNDMGMTPSESFDVIFGETFPLADNPTALEEIVEKEINALMSNARVTNLTQEDKSFLIKELGRYEAKTEKEFKKSIDKLNKEMSKYSKDSDKYFSLETDLVDTQISLENSRLIKNELQNQIYNFEVEKRIPDFRQDGIHFTPESKEFFAENTQPLFKKGGSETPNLDPGLEKVNESISSLSPEGQNAFREFIKWRESVVKEYQKRDIPINVLERYVPFVFTRKGNADEMAALNSLFGTGSTPDTDDFSSLMGWLSGHDPNLKPRTTQAKSPSEVNAILSKDILSEDAAVIMATRGSRAIQAQELFDFADDFAGKYGLSIDEMQDYKLLRGYKLYKPEATPDGRKLFKEISATNISEGNEKALFLPEEMVKIYNEYSDIMFGQEGMNKLLKTFDKATSYYKKIAYLWNPGHIARDFSGNVFNGYLMGLTSPKIYKEALDYMMNPEMLVKIKGFPEMKASDFIRKARQNGILDIAGSLAEFSNDKIVGVKRASNIGSAALKKYDWAMRQGTKQSDSYTRLAGLIYNLRNGKSWDEAAVQVKKFYFDYFELTSFERKVMKRVIPFYTWMRKNIPLQIEMLVKNPRELARMSKMMNAAAGEPIDWSEQPEYIQDMGAFPVGNSNHYASLNLPFSDISRGVPSINALQDWLSAVNPLLRGPVEMATNAQWFNGRPLENYEGEQQELPLTGILRALGMNNLPTVNKRGAGYVMNQLPLLRNLDSITDPTNPRQKQKASTFLGGPGLYNKEAVQTSADYEQLNRLNALIQMIKAEQEKAQGL